VDDVVVVVVVVWTDDTRVSDCTTGCTRLDVAEYA
jgi:hypothetical protein